MRLTGYAETAEKILVMGSRTITFDRHPALDLKQRALLYEVMRELAGRIQLDELLQLVIAKAKEILDAESAAILLWDKESNELYFPYIDDVDASTEERFREVRFPADRGIAGWVLRNNESELVLDVRNDPRWYGNVDRESGMTTMSLLCSPLRGHHQSLGVIQLRNKRNGQFSKPDLELLDALAASVAGAIENARAFDEAKRRKEELQAKLVAMERSAERDTRFAEIVGDSPAIQRVFQEIECTLTTPVPVLLQGETGTGKELVARAIHDNGPRRHRPFVAVDCGTLQEALIESALFGHRRGAFTGAIEDRTGFFEVADGGTIFLDEIGNMPPQLQTRLLRVLQESEIVRVGDTVPIRIDVRVISATHVDLDEAQRCGRFRDDLYFRLSTFPIRVPPLRERTSDIPALATRFLQRAAERFGKRAAGISPDALAAFSHYSWPGNVRELCNEIERALTVVPEGGMIGVQHLSSRFGGNIGSATACEPLERLTLKEAVARFEQTFLREELRRNGGNVSETALQLEISRSNLHNKLRDYGIERSADGMKRNPAKPRSMRTSTRT